MKKFRYVFDPLFLAAVLAYVVNRWLLIPNIPSDFLRGTFNDLLLIPAALPPLLWLQRRWNWRTHDLPPTAGEIVGHWFLWSLISEGLAPRIFAHSVADFQDVVAYAVGALGAGLWWNRRWYRPFFRARTRGFDRLAQAYDGMECVLAGGKLMRCRTFFLASLPPPDRVLLVGEGHGRFLTALIQAHPLAEITCVDASARMLAVTRRRLRGLTLQGRVRLLQRDLRDWCPPPASQDLIVTHFFLDCFPPAELADVMSRLSDAARPGAHWLSGDFHQPTAPGWRRLRADVILWIMYRFFRVVTRLPASHLTPPEPIFGRLGWNRIHRREFEWGLLVSEVWRKPTEKYSSSPRT